MAFISIDFFSEALGMQTEVYVLIPQRGNYGEIGTDSLETSGKYKTLYLLHGLSDDHTIWLRRTSIERYSAKYGIAVIMPCAGKSFYTDMKYGMNYYTFIARELPARMREFFRLSEKREDNYVAGLSMGGYGALKIALRECDRFCAGAGLSSAADIRERLLIWSDLGKTIFGDPPVVSEDDDLFALAEKRRSDPNRPKLFLGVGKDDFLYEDNQKLKKKLTECGYDLTYRESPGAHTWEFWDEYVQYVLEWMLK